jgi:hypothetical protein
MMKRLIYVALVTILMAGLLPLGMFNRAKPAEAAAAPAFQSTGPAQPALSPIWKKTIQQWATQISELADIYGLDPDFVAAVVREESDGDPRVVSRVGAVGLMGVMPTSPGLEWRPKVEELKDPTINLRWGVAILSEIVRQSGGDLYSALAAYSGGWDRVNSRVPRNYAASVLDYYGRAIVARNGISPDIASRWTLAIEIRRGHVPTEPLLVLGNQPVSGLITYGEHMVFDYVDQTGRSYYVKGYAVPVALIVPIGSDSTSFGSADTLEIELQARLGETSAKITSSNPRILIACLPSLSRLRGHASTRWFAPSYCPSWHR